MNKEIYTVKARAFSREELLIVKRQKQQTLFVYEYVKEIKPNTIVELGVGSGGLTIAMAVALKEVNPEGKIHSYDIQSLSQLLQIDWMKAARAPSFHRVDGYRGIVKELEERGLSANNSLWNDLCRRYDYVPLTASFVDMCTFTKGDCHETFVKNPIPFDLLLIDAGQGWDDIYKIVIENNFINNQIKSGARVIIEGGAKRHPLINEKTFKNFNKKFKKPPFNYECVAVGTNDTGRWYDMSSISILELN